ncbi:TIGR04141 family sporadically distributed protein, partial [Mycolicibacterium moriokaense]
MPPALVRCHVVVDSSCPNTRATESHNDWTTTAGSPQGEIEADYNARLAETSPERLLKLDARIKRPGGASSGIEFCDVLSDQGDLIHVKRKSRSATLSHLFAQGAVSASTFINDGVFRTQVRQLIEDEVATDAREAWLRLVPGADEAVDRSQYRVTYAVIANSTR